MKRLFLILLFVSMSWADVPNVIPEKVKLKELPALLNRNFQELDRLLLNVRGRTFDLAVSTGIIAEEVDKTLWGRDVRAEQRYGYAGQRDDDIQGQINDLYLIKLARGVRKEVKVYRTMVLPLWISNTDIYFENSAGNLTTSLLGNGGFVRFGSTITNSTHVNLGINSTINTSEFYSTIAGGTDNTITRGECFIGAGGSNIVGDRHGGIVSGKWNTIGLDGQYAFIGAGILNLNNSDYAGICSGYKVVISTNSNASFAGAGFENKIEDSHYAGIVAGKELTLLNDSYGSFMGAGYQNAMDNCNYSSILCGQNIQMTDSDHSGVFSGTGNQMDNSNYSGIFSGLGNMITDSNGSAILGGVANKITGSHYSMVGGRFMELSSTADRTFLWGNSDTAVTVTTPDIFGIYSGNTEPTLRLYCGSINDFVDISYSSVTDSVSVSKDIIGVISTATYAYNAGTATYADNAGLLNNHDSTYFATASSMTGISDNYARKDSSPTWTGQNTFTNMVTISSKTKIVVVSGGALEAGNSGCSATGALAVAMGGNTIASGVASIAMGASAIASGQYSIAMGYDAIASGEKSMAMGESTRASGYNSMAMGSFTIASVDNSMAMGNNARASGGNSIAMGYGSKASGENSIAMGQGINANGTNSFAIALNNQSGTVIGQDNTMAIMGGRFSVGIATPSYGVEFGTTTLLKYEVHTTTIQAQDSNGLYGLDDGGNLGWFVKDGGNVGIGTDNPDQELEVYGVSPIIRIRATGSTGDAAAYVEFGRTTGGDWVRTGYVGDGISGDEDIYIVAKVNDLHLGDSSGTKIVNLTGGDVGIGVVNPDAKLHVKGVIRVADPTSTRYFIEVFSSGGVGYIDSYDSTGNDYQDLVVRADDFIFEGQGTERFRIEDTGNIGIGTDSPTVKLDVNGGGKFVSSCTASSFHGDGTALTNVDAETLDGYDSTDFLLASYIVLNRIAVKSGEIATHKGNVAYKTN